ncbi:hypothetical protein [Sporosarcina trichiuri]|nr:hypothetical protein [Sporosarcina sp. 0.2-SM1T-5]WJY28271.1 hypothetical protein QWT68_04620 [Sporosarcina sp. 0.2-SM1T-5]
MLAMIGLLLTILFRASVLAMIQSFAGPALIFDAAYFFYLVRQSLAKPQE